jgi:TonB-dependent SusC/RagA subfamily outer membrane receptor
MKLHMLSRSRHRPQIGRPLLRRTGSIPLLLFAPVLAGCVASAPVQRETDFSVRGGCRAELVIHELLGRYPGVQVKREGSGLRVRIRGALQEPLYVVDAQPLAPASDGVLSAVNPCDIKQIRVLRDPADLTFYGLRGANGVVLITTRQR